MIYIGFRKCGKTAEEMHKTGVSLRDSMLNKLCKDYNPKNITHTPKGKPLYENIGFSISHSNGAVAVAVNAPQTQKDIDEDWLTLSGGTDISVGVDIEPIDRKVNIKSVSKRFLSEKEREYASEDKTRFLEIWTKKESACKLTGKGVSMLSGFSCLDDNNICIETRRVYVGQLEYIMSVSYYKILD